MSNISKFAVTGLAVALFGTAPGVATADGHEQARQLLQRSEPGTEVTPVVRAAVVVARDGHEQARYMIEGAGFAAPVSRQQYASVAVIAEPDEAIDGQTKARNLLDRSLVMQARSTRVSRASAVQATRNSARQ